MKCPLALGPALAIALAILAGCSKENATPRPSGGLIKVRFQTDWYPQPEHGGYYQAVARGFYADEGLDVDIVPGGPNAQVLSSVAVGRADLGMTNGDDTIVAIARGVPVRIVAAEMQRDAQGILYHQSHPVRTLRDLDGRTLMAGAGSTWIQVVQRKLGIHFTLRPLIGDLARFMNDPTFIQQCFVTNEPYFARQKGADVGALLIANPEIGYEPYRVIFTGNSYLDEHPEVVRKFVRASVRGWIDYLTGDPAPGNEAIRRRRPELTPEFMAYSIKAMKDYQLVLGDPSRGESAGHLDRDRLAGQIKLLKEMGILAKPLEVDDVARFDFLPAPAG